MEYQKNCSGCNEIFTSADERKIYHSKKCKIKARGKRQRQRKRNNRININKIEYDKICPGCSVEFTTNIKRKIYHSRECGQTTLAKKWYEKNKKKTIKQNSKNHKRRLETDIFYRAKDRFRRMFKTACRLNGLSKKSKSTFSFLDYTFEQYRNYIETLFKLPGNEWMTWENQGPYKIEVWDDNNKSTWTWHLYQVVSQANLPFDDFNQPNFKKCWALTNLRPYSAKKNIEEGNRRSEEDIFRIKSHLGLLLKNK